VTARLPCVTVGPGDQPAGQVGPEAHFALAKGVRGLRGQPEAYEGESGDEQRHRPSPGARPPRPPPARRAWTFETHLRRVRAKFGIGNTAELTRFLLEREPRED
jgi:hypothetical protein